MIFLLSFVWIRYFLRRKLVLAFVVTALVSIGVVQVLQDNKMKNISVYDLSSATEEKFVVLTTTNKVVDSKKVADVIAEKFHYDEKKTSHFSVFCPLPVFLQCALP